MDPRSMILGMTLIMSATTVALVGIWARSRRQVVRQDPPRLDAVEARLAELQHSVDSIAVEIERISEGQRFTTKLLADRAEKQAVVPGSASVL